MGQMSMSVGEVAELCHAVELNGIDLKTDIPDISSDSRQIHSGDLFFAYRGPEVDGHSFIQSAYENGACAAVVTRAEALDTRPGLLVEDGVGSFSLACARIEGDPSMGMKVIGITGTNGKTTTHWMLYHAMNRLKSPCLRIGSLGIESETGHIERSGKVQTLKSGEIVMTTPGPREIHRVLRLAKEAGVVSCVLETSSHAIHQKRTSSVRYDVALFTNLSPDHLNYHPDMEAYFDVKYALFEQLESNRKTKKIQHGGAVVNRDCPYGKKMAERVAKLALPLLCFGQDPGCQIRILNFEQGIPQSTLELSFMEHNYFITTSLIGGYNASNLAGAFAVLVSLGYEPRNAADALSDLPSVPGRLEPVGSEDVPVYVDYAHTGVGLENVLKAVKSFVKGDLWVVFGCGGGKDPRKRMDMGVAAKNHADKIVLTDDNPKHESPEKIMNEILLSGCEPEFMIHDRAEAILKAVTSAKKGDVVILAGKGHEDYQIFGSQTFHFSDQEEVEKAKKRGLLTRH